jgi:hypothetical protein
MKNEYVIVEEVLNAVEIGKACISQLGDKSYPFIALSEMTESRNKFIDASRYYDPLRVKKLYDPEFSGYKNIMAESLTK